MTFNLNKMMQSFYVSVILSACIIAANLADSAQAAHATTNIFKPPAESKVGDIEDNSTPWVKDEFISTIEDFKNDVLEDLQNSDTVKKIWDMETDSETARDVFFKVFNKFFTDIDHPVPTAFANVISKSASLFDPLTVPIRFEAVAINLAEFLLAHDMEIEESTSQNYVDFVTSALDKADLNDPVSILEADLEAYVGFIQSYGFNIPEEADELFLLFSSALIVLHDK